MYCFSMIHETLPSVIYGHFVYSLSEACLHFVQTIDQIAQFSINLRVMFLSLNVLAALVNPM